MSKDPAFLFYDGDAARDVSHMTRLERGCYFDLIQAQRKFNGYTVEQARKILGKDFEECWPALELILLCEDGIYFIEWVRESMIKRKEHSIKQSKRIQDYWDKRNNHGNTTVLPLENENENENVIEIKKEIKPKKETEEERLKKFTDEIKQHTEYERQMLIDFYNHWTEKDKKGNFKFELEKTWSTAGRLAKWKKNDEIFYPKQKDEPTRRHKLL